MSEMKPRTGSRWTIIVDNVVVRRELLTDDNQDDVEVSYAVTHKGDPYLSGSLTWENETTGVEDAWSTEFSLPSTPGVCVVTVFVIKDTAFGTLSQSIKVI